MSTIKSGPPDPRAVIAGLFSRRITAKVQPGARFVIPANAPDNKSVAERCAQALIADDIVNYVNSMREKCTLYDIDCIESICAAAALAIHACKSEFGSDVAWDAAEFLKGVVRELETSRSRRTRRP